MVVYLRVLKKEISRGVFRTLSNEVFLEEVVMSFNRLLFSQKSSVMAVVRHNPKYVSDIFLAIFTAVLLDCLKQTYQIFRTAIF